jgi:serine/threonine protein kinase
MLAGADTEEDRATMTQENILARYAILHELGCGATGAVYAARDRKTGALVALKRLDPALSSKSGAGSAERFLKQARAARLLKHRNIVTIHDAGAVAGTVHVVMEMLEGQSLRKLLDAGPIPIARAIQIARDIAGGLAHAHLEGVVHGAINPSNVIVLRSGAVKITDFGTGQAALLSEAPAGCVGYMAPEQVRGDPVDHRCDLFSLGALFYELLTHRPPFEGGSPKHIVENRVHARPPLPSELNPLVPRALDAIVLRMLAGDPAARTPGAPILLGELQRIEEALGLGSTTSAGTGEPPASVERATPPEPELRTPEPNRVRDRAPAPEAPAFDYEAMVMMERESRQARPRSSRTGMPTMLVLVLAVLGIGAAGFMYYSSGPSEREVTASPLPRAEAVVPAAPDPTPPKPLPAEPAPLAQNEAAVSRPPEEPASPAAEPAQPPPPAAQPTVKVADPQPRATARLMLAVSPRGEVYIDGKHHGTTPPLTTLDLEPGMHRVEVRSGSRKPYLTYMTVQAGDVRRIRHEFNASRAVRPPGRLARRNDP